MDKPDLPPPSAVERETVARIIWTHFMSSHGGPWYAGAKPEDSHAMRASFEATDAILAAQASTRQAAVPVAWRVKDFADGWIVFGSEAEALAEVAQTGAAMEELYAAPPRQAAEQALALAPTQALARFARKMLSALWEGFGADGNDIQEAALKCGLIQRTAFDPEKHTDLHGVGVYPGDEWFEELPWVRALAALPQAEAGEKGE